MSDMGVPAVENFDQGAVAANTNAEKGLVLQALAQGGTDMAKQVAATQSTMASGINAALAAAEGNAAHSAVAGDPNFAREEAGKITGQGDYFKGILKAQGDSQQQFMGNLGSANSRYMDQVNAAIPISHAQTQRELNSLSSAAQSAQKDRAMRQQIAAMQLEETKERIAANREDRARANNPDAERLELELLQQRAEAGRRDLADPGWDRAPKDRSEDEITRARGAAYDSILNEVQGGRGGQGGQALAFVLNNARTQQEADYILSQVTGQGYDVGGTVIKYQTPGKKQLNQDYLRGFLGKFYGA